jgi:eukaryotic-like serine/threonine-protein kinase
LSDSSFYKQDTLPDFTSSEKEGSSLPERIGPYKIESLLNKGGMSLLYLGLHPETRELLAIKVLSPAYLTHPDAVERFLKESEIIALTNHPNIVKLYGQGEWEGGLYIVMELIRGISLRQFILQQSLSLKRSLDIILQVAYALLHLHTHRVIHRDLKPENILITEEGEIKVIDFGIAGLHDEKEVREQTLTASIMGTPHYMSPEQKEDPLKVSYASDIYSLGIITFELVLGRLSYGIINLSLLPKGLRKIVGQALAPSLTERYQDIVDFISDISQYLKSGEWEKDRPGTDQMKEFLESMQRVSQDLSPLSAPRWPETEIGIAKYKALGQMGLYYDFFKLPHQTYGVLLSVASSNHLDGAVYSAWFKGIVRGYLQTSLDKRPEPTALLSFLTESYAQAPVEQTFAFYFLILDPSRDQLSFLSCGMGDLFHLSLPTRTPRILSTSNSALGSPLPGEPSMTTDNWNVGDSLILHTLSARFSPDESLEEEPPLLAEAVSESAFLSAQSQAESILKKMASQTPLLQKHPHAILTIQRLA